MGRCFFVPFHSLLSLTKYDKPRFGLPSQLANLHSIIPDIPDRRIILKGICRDTEFPLRLSEMRQGEAYERGFAEFYLSQSA